MPDRRGRKGSKYDLIPKEGRRQWAEGIWRDQTELRLSYTGIGLLREAAKILGYPEEAVDRIIKPPRK
ncbi:hypothetical protein EF888_07140 [Silicimonas algicola]|nr:hypothetical protein [Silicimonas algicola]AZQ66933.1 hypothetical protein EF888_07140 [Silicimonas algicola]